MPSSRRQVLGLFAGGSLLNLSGCQSGSDTTTSPTATPATCDPTDERRITVGETATISSDVELSAKLSARATMERELVTADGPARLQVTLMNQGPSIETDVHAGRRCHLFDRGKGRSDPEGLWLYHHEDPPTEHEAGCWTQKEVPSRTRTFSTYGCPRQTFASQATITTTLVVWDDYATAGYYPTGDYRFEVSIPIWLVESDEGTTDQDRYDRLVDWWLDLQVTELDP